MAQVQARKHNKWPRAALALLPTLLSACALISPEAALRAPADDVQVVAIGSIPAQKPAPLSGAMIRQLAALSVQIEDFPLPGEKLQWQYELASIESLARQGVLGTAQTRLDALAGQVEQHTGTYFRHHAKLYLSRARQFAFLSDDQAQQLRALELAAARGQYVEVYRQGRALVHQLWSADAWLSAKPGDTLARLAARPAVYDNYRLWPLIKAANPGYFYRGQAVQPGWRLRYPLHPTLDEIFAIVEAGR